MNKQSQWENRLAMETKGECDAEATPESSRTS